MIRRHATRPLGCMWPTLGPATCAAVNTSTSRSTGQKQAGGKGSIFGCASNDDGARFLVERLWPRGLSKERLHLTAWLKEVGPSTGLRQWFNHDPQKWSQFRTRYFRELDSQPESWRPILAAARRGMVTLVYSSHDEEHNNAVALKAYLQAKRRQPSSRRRSASANPRRPAR